MFAIFFFFFFFLPFSNKELSKYINAKFLKYSPYLQLFKIRICSKKAHSWHKNKFSKNSWMRNLLNMFCNLKNCLSC